MSNEYELARDSRQDLIFTKEQLLAPLLPGMERPPHPMRLGDSEKDYYLGALTNPGTSAGAERIADGCAKEMTRDSQLAAGGDDRDRRGGHLLDPRPARRPRRARHGGRPQRRALGAVAGADHALPGRVLRDRRPARSSAWRRSSSTPAPS